jgi:hypothetical protein
MTKQIDNELLKLIEDMGCLCGIPGCMGHEDLGGFTLLEVSKLRTRERASGNESNPPGPDDGP